MWPRYFHQIQTYSLWWLTLKRKNILIKHNRVCWLKTNTHRPPVWWRSGSRSCGCPCRPVWQPARWCGSAHTSAGWTGQHKAHVWFGSDCVWRSSIPRCRTGWCRLREAVAPTTRSPRWIRCSHRSNHKVGCQALQQTRKVSTRANVTQQINK